MTTNIDNLKRLLAEFEADYHAPLSMPTADSYERGIERLNREIFEQAQVYGKVSPELQSQRDRWEGQWQMAKTYAPFINSLPDLLAERDRLREALRTIIVTPLAIDDARDIARGALAESEGE